MADEKLNSVEEIKTLLGKIYSGKPSEAQANLAYINEKIGGVDGFFKSGGTVSFDEKNGDLVFVSKDGMRKDTITIDPGKTQAGAQAKDASQPTAAAAEKSFWERIKDAFGKDTDAASKKFDELSEEGKKLATEYYEYAKHSEAGKKIMSMAEYAKEKGIALGNDALKTTENFWETYAPQGLKDAAKQTGNFLGDMFSKAGNFLGGNAKSIGVGLLSAIGIAALVDGIGIVGALLIGLLVAGIASAAGMDGEKGMLSGLFKKSDTPGGPSLEPGKEVGFGLGKNNEPVWDLEKRQHEAEKIVAGKVSNDGKSLLVTGIAFKNAGNGQFPTETGTTAVTYEDVSALGISVPLSARKDGRPNVEDPSVQDAIARAETAARQQIAGRAEAARKQAGAPTGQFESAKTQGPDGAAVNTPAGNAALTTNRGGPEAMPAAGH